MDDIRKITLEEAEYPELLREIHSPPDALYVRGKIPKGTLFAIVGTRLPTTYGKQVTPNIVERLSAGGLTIVSGLAYGIDAISHEAALTAGGLTIAVLGTGIDEESLYPRKHIKLARRIIESGGAVISEYPEGTPGQKHHFPARNRIVSGMSRGVLIVEAKEKSGALITAKHAVEQNRDVFAVPGTITNPFSVGPNRLIKDGATPVLSPSDILDEYGLSAQSKVNKNTQNATFDEMRVLDALTQGALHVDVIADIMKTPASSALALLTQMELKGLIRNVGSGTYTTI